MKRYFANPDPGGALSVTVSILGQPEADYPLPHHVLHSPTGFNSGYGGSGPAELARCILIDHFHLREEAEKLGPQLVLPVSYQQFKFDVIARLPRGEWSIDETLVEAWVRGHSPDPEETACTCSDGDDEHTATCPASRWAAAADEGVGV